nr:hypothetical protein [Tanacetum cinerariifolium]
ELGHKGDIKSITEVVVDQIPNQEFDALLSEEEIISFTKELGHKGDIKSITEVKIRDPPAYKTYLAFSTGTTSPKKAKKFKKPASPSKKRTLVTVEKEEPEPAKKFLSPRSLLGNSLLVYKSETLLVCLCQRRGHQ